MKLSFKTGILFSFILTIVPILSACGAQASTNTSTTTPNVSVKTIVLQEGKSETITAGGTYSISGTLSDGQIVVDTTGTITLELAGVHIQNSSGPALQINNAKATTIILPAGTTNTLTDGGESEFNAAIFSNDTLTISGDGSLVITGNQGHGIESDDNIIINGGNISITAKTDGIHANDNVTINGGNIQIPSAYEGIESKGNVVINDGTIEIFSNDDGINATLNITINGGNLYAKSEIGDAMDSNGTIDMKGGTTVLIGAGQPEGGIDCDRSNLNITGGTLVATGGSNSTPSESTSTQRTVMLSGSAAGTIYHIADETNAVLTFMPDTAFQSIVFSSPLIQADTTYSIYTGGTASGGSDFHGLYSGASYTEGTKGESFTTTNMVTIQGGSTGMGGGMGGGGMGERPQGGQRPAQGEMPPQGEMPIQGGVLPSSVPAV